MAVWLQRVIGRASDEHQEAAEMVLTYVVTDTPKGVVPVVALDELGVTGCHKSRMEEWLRELLAEQVLHDCEPDLGPVRPERHSPAEALGVCGRLATCDAPPVVGIEALSCLIRVLD